MPPKKHDCIQEVSIALITERMKNIESKLDNVDIKLDKFMKDIKENYLTKSEYTLLKDDYSDFKNKMWVINLAILVALIGSAITLIVK